MPTFEVRIVESIKAREIVAQLFINGIGQLDALENDLQGTTFMGEFIGLIAFIQHFANGGPPGKKVKYLKGGEGPTEFEFLSKHLRIYAIQQPNKKIVIFGGKKRKADSSDNIKIFRRIESEFLKSLITKK